MMLLFWLRRFMHATWSSCLLVYENTQLLALLQDNCLDLFHCAFLRKLPGCVRNITVFCQHLQRPMKLSVLVDTDISARPIYQFISKFYCFHVIQMFLLLLPSQSFILIAVRC